METSQTFQRAFAIWFKDLARWDPASFHGISWHWPKEVMSPIGSVLKQRKEKVDRSKVAFADLQPITIHFDGSIDPREVNENREYTMELFFARPGDIVVAKIDLKNGAVGIIPSHMKNTVVTGHFAVYEPDLAKLTPEYLLRIIQTKFFKAYLWRNKVGAEGRKEVKLDFFNLIEIPLPSLSTQKAIIERWANSKREIQEIRGELILLEKSYLSNIQKALGRNSRNGLTQPKAFALWWSEIERWGVDICWRRKTQSESSKYPLMKIKDLCKVGSGGTPSRRVASYFGGDIPWVKTTEVRGEVIDKTEETITRAGLENSSAKIYQAGSLIIAMYGQGATRGRTAKLGIAAATNQACAVLTQFDKRIEPDFLWYYLMSEYDSLRELASGNNQPNLNADMIANYSVPLPPLSVQRSIINQVEEARTQIAQQRKTSERKAHEAEAEVEALILGTKKI